MSPVSPQANPYSPPNPENQIISPKAPNSPGQSTLAHYRNLREQKVQELTQNSTTAYL